MQIIALDLKLTLVQFLLASLVNRALPVGSFAVILLLTVPWRLFLFGSLVILDRLCCFFIVSFVIYKYRKR